ncbi:unnamed protein product [Spirodela intermedia]|uniref:Uncharacterized protein n=1 Tax=Spirodela intermedia TaxID=51605 RepID=A0A7I8IHT8_SPIIN|nr:unnamed protein product [Spirodela intermedia]CAA6656946.1 unnamed protein product [Spirodela intermedia]
MDKTFFPSFLTTSSSPLAACSSMPSAACAACGRSPSVPPPLSVQSFRNHGSRMISSTVLLVSGLVSRSRPMRRFSSGENQRGQRNSPRQIFLYMAIRLGSLKGGTQPLLGEDLGRDVRRRAAERVQQPVVPGLVGDGAEAEVRHLKVAVLVEKEVLWLQVPLTALHELHDEVDLRSRGEDLGEADDMGVAEPPHDGDLPLDVRRQPSLDNPLLADALHGGALARADILREVDLGEGSPPQKPP